MNFDKQFTHIASLLGDRARSLMMWNLLDGRAYTATELAVCANVSAQSASNHLKKLVDAKLLKVEKQGRHRYYRLASPKVAYTIESIANLLPSETKPPSQKGTKPKGEAYARTCYDHLAGKAGVLITKALLNHNIIENAEEKYRVTDEGIEWFEAIDINISALKSQRRSFAYPCLDWSERKHHIAGALGAALLNKMIEKDWIRKKRNSREVTFSYKGRKKLYSLLKLSL